MATRTLYFDESGYTGYNLLDKNQPIFAIASTDIAPSLANEILRASFPRYRGREYKFTNIWRSSNKKGLIEFGRHLSDLEDQIFCWVMDKSFVVLTKIVDFLIEPCLTNAGYDFYSDGFCWKYTNHIYFGFREFAPPSLLARLLTSYQRFSRQPSETELRRLQRVLHGLKANAPEEVAAYLDQMELGAKVFPEFHDFATFRQSNEIQVTSMMATIAHWRIARSEDFEVVHDATANFFRRREIWERMTNSDVPNQIHQKGDGTPVEFPLRVTSTTPVNSETNHSVQFCDILAGLTTRVFDQRIGDSDRALLDNVINVGLGNIDYNGVRPGTIFPDRIPPKRLSGPDKVDEMTEIIFGQHHATRGDNS